VQGTILPHPTLTLFWGQVVDCRRILKWTYAYGYYRFGEQAVNGAAAAVSRDVLRQRQEFFEFNQARACAGGVVAEPGLLKVRRRS